MQKWKQTEQLRTQLERLVESQKMTEQEADCIRIWDIQEICGFRAGAEDEEGCCAKDSFTESSLL